MDCAARGDKEIGDKMNKIIATLAEAANDIPSPSEPWQF